MFNPLLHNNAFEISHISKYYGKMEHLLFYSKGFKTKLKFFLIFFYQGCLKVENEVMIYK